MEPSPRRIPTRGSLKQASSPARRSSPRRTATTPTAPSTSSSSKPNARTGSKKANSTASKKGSNNRKPPRHPSSTGTKATATRGSRKKSASKTVESLLESPLSTSSEESEEPAIKSLKYKDLMAIHKQLDKNPTTPRMLIKSLGKQIRLRSDKGRSYLRNATTEEGPHSDEFYGLIMNVSLYLWDDVLQCYVPYIPYDMEHLHLYLTFLYKNLCQNDLKKGPQSVVKQHIFGNSHSGLGEALIDMFKERFYLRAKERDYYNNSDDFKTMVEGAMREALIKLGADQASAEVNNRFGKLEDNVTDLYGIAGQTGVRMNNLEQVHQQHGDDLSSYKNRMTSAEKQISSLKELVQRSSAQKAAQTAAESGHVGLAAHMAPLTLQFEPSPVPPSPALHYNTGTPIPDGEKKMPARSSRDAPTDSMDIQSATGLAEAGFNTPLLPSSTGVHGTGSTTGAAASSDGSSAFGSHFGQDTSSQAFGSGASSGVNMGAGTTTPHSTENPTSSSSTVPLFQGGNQGVARSAGSATGSGVSRYPKASFVNWKPAASLQTMADVGAMSTTMPQSADNSGLAGAGFDGVGDRGTRHTSGFFKGKGWGNPSAQAAGGQPTVAGNHETAFGSGGTLGTWTGCMNPTAAATSLAGGRAGGIDANAFGKTVPTSSLFKSNRSTNAARPIGVGATVAAGNEVNATENTVPFSNLFNSKRSANAAPPIGAGATVAAPFLAQSPSHVQGSSGGKRRKVAPQDLSMPRFANGASDTVPSTVGATWGKRRMPGSANAAYSGPSSEAIPGPANAASSTARSTLGPWSGQRRTLKARRPSVAAAKRPPTPSMSAVERPPTPSMAEMFKGFGEVVNRTNLAP